MLLWFFTETLRNEGKTLPINYSPMKMAQIAQSLQIIEDANVN